MKKTSAKWYICKGTPQQHQEVREFIVKNQFSSDVESGFIVEKSNSVNLIAKYIYHTHVFSEKVFPDGSSNYVDEVIQVITPFQLSTKGVGLEVFPTRFGSRALLKVLTSISEGKLMPKPLTVNLSTLLDYLRSREVSFSLKEVKVAALQWSPSTQVAFTVHGGNVMKTLGEVVSGKNFTLSSIKLHALNGEQAKITISRSATCRVESSSPMRTFKFIREAVAESASCN